VKHLLLFDIDGTLVRGGPAKKAFEEALKEVFGTAGRINGHDFSGKTDPQIARELLEGAGFSGGEIDTGLPKLWEEYLTRMSRGLRQNPMELIPGARETVDHLNGLREVALGLLTGNIVEGARLKLGSVGMADHFPIGGFGSDSEVRDHLPAFAMERAREKWGVVFSPERVVVVGDTPRDVACGRFGGTRTVGVATGRFDVASLKEAGADHVLPHMENLQETVAALLD
jgi:phosphoglycolate phosphatase-like HAD superfamily hydrolase